ncbi:MAG: hypothetical protein E7351_02665 [Clostridiales bacterium]|nr:hypothetical protein [Clostridiales bacterium]
MTDKKKVVKLPAGVWYILLNSLSMTFGRMSIRFMISLTSIKKGNSTGKILNAHTLIAFRQELEQIVGLIMKKMHTIIRKSTIILFDFKILIIYNNI